MTPHPLTEIKQWAASLQGSLIWECNMGTMSGELTGEDGSAPRVPWPDSPAGRPRFIQIIYTFDHEMIVLLQSVCLF